MLIDSKTVGNNRSKWCCTRTAGIDRNIKLSTWLSSYRLDLVILTNLPYLNEWPIKSISNLIILTLKHALHVIGCVCIWMQLLRWYNDECASFRFICGAITIQTFMPKSFTKNINLLIQVLLKFSRIQLSGSSFRKRMHRWSVYGWVTVWKWYAFDWI